MPQVIDKNWADGIGFGVRPWTPNDHLRDAVIDGLTVRNVANDKAIYVVVGSEFDYLRGKGLKGFENKKQCPAGQGIWFKSVTVRNAVVDGVARRDNAKVKGAHTDAIYVGSDKGANASGAKTDVTFENIIIRNCDGSCMAALVQNPTVLGTLTFRNVIVEESVQQKRIVLKPGISIDCIRFENCGTLKLSPDSSNLRIGRVEIVNSPSVDARDVAKFGVEVVVEASSPPKAERVIEKEEIFYENGVRTYSVIYYSDGTNERQQ